MKLQSLISRLQPRKRGALDVIDAQYSDALNLLQSIDVNKSFELKNTYSDYAATSFKRVHDLVNNYAMECKSKMMAIPKTVSRKAYMSVLLYFYTFYIRYDIFKNDIAYKDQLVGIAFDYLEEIHTAILNYEVSFRQESEVDYQYLHQHLSLLYLLADETTLAFDTIEQYSVVEPKGVKGKLYYYIRYCIATRLGKSEQIVEYQNKLLELECREQTIEQLVIENDLVAESKKHPQTPPNLIELYESSAYGICPPNSSLAAHIRDFFANCTNVDEKQNTGVLSFFVNGKTFIRIEENEMRCRVGIVNRPISNVLIISEWIYKGRPMPGWVSLTFDEANTCHELAHWAAMALEYSTEN